MSRDFIGSKISIITKSQCRYSGTIIGIDSQTSSIVLGNCRSFGVENRPTTSSNTGHTPGTVLPIVQFANSDIEDLKIVDEEQTSEPIGQQSSFSPSTRASIHDDPAIVSAVVSSANKDKNNVLNGTSSGVSSNHLIQNLQHMSLNDDRSKTNESRLRSNGDELGAPWSLLSSSTSKFEQNSKLHHTNTSTHQNLGQKSKFFDDFFADKSTSNNNNNNRMNNQRSSNTHSTQTSRENAGHQYDTNGLPVRQPFFSNNDRDRSYPQRQQQQQQYHHQQQQYRNQNGYNQRQFYNQRRPFNNSNQQRRTGPGGFGGGNRETFQDNPNDYDADFDFETNNMKFNKLTGEDELKSPEEQQNPVQTNVDASPLYDKKKSFFDNLALGESNEGPASYSNNRSKNHDTFGYNGYQRQNYRSNGHGGYRRSNNNNNYRQQYGDEDFHYRQHNNNNNNNGYRYRY